MSQGGLWHERTSEALFGKLRGRELHYFSALLEAGALDSLWQIHRKWALSLRTSAEGDESCCKLKCSFFNISGMLGLGKMTGSKGVLSLEDITCHFGDHSLYFWTYIIKSGGTKYEKLGILTDI